MRSGRRYGRSPLGLCWERFVDASLVWANAAELTHRAQGNGNRRLPRPTHLSQLQRQKRFRQIAAGKQRAMPVLFTGRGGQVNHLAETAGGRTDDAFGQGFQPFGQIERLVDRGRISHRLI